MAARAEGVPAGLAVQLGQATDELRALSRRADEQLTLDKQAALARGADRRSAQSTPWGMGGGPCGSMPPALIRRVWRP